MSLENKHLEEYINENCKRLRLEQLEDVPNESMRIIMDLQKQQTRTLRK